MRQFVALSVVLTVTLMMGCGGQEVPLPSSGRDYFPMKVGAELEYRMDSIIFDDAPNGNTRDTFSGFVLERVASAEPLGGSDSLFTIERMFRRGEGENWSLTDIWTMESDERNAYRTEENQVLVKMRFPLTLNTLWDPTEFVSDDTEVEVGTEFIEMFTNWAGRVISIGEPAAIGSLVFEDVLTVQQADDDNEIERRFVFEQYAAGIGLIFRADTIVDSRCKRLGDLLPCFDNIDGELVSQPWERKAEKGYIMRQQLIRYN